jgi:hypothetical protein
MSRRRLTNIILVLVNLVFFALVLSTSHLLDGDTGHALAPQQDSSAAQARFARAAQTMCGENAGWTMLADGAVQCRTKRGHKTITAQVAE